MAYNVIGYTTTIKAIRSFKPDLIYDRYITFNYSIVAAANKCNIPIFLEVNAPLAYEREMEPDETLFFKKLAYKIENKTCNNANKVIVVSTPLKDYLVSNGVSSSHINVLPNGVNTEKFYPKEKPSTLLKQLSIQQDDVVIGFVGILRPWHGIDFLIKAFKDVVEKCPNARLLLVGDGPIQNEIEQQASEHGLAERITITGRIKHDKVGDYIALFDIAVSPKATFYASPMKIIEYMAQQKPTVAPDMSNIRDIIQDHVDGLLFEPQSVEALSRTLVELSLDSQKRKDLGQKALVTVQNRLNWKNNAIYVENSYKTIT